MERFIIRLPKAVAKKDKVSNLDNSNRTQSETETTLTKRTYYESISKLQMPFTNSKEPKASSASRSTQLFLDLGQNGFGKASQCKKCGLLFTLDDEEDRKQHLSFCAEIKQPATLPTLTGHNVVCRLQQDNNCIILIQPGQMKIHKDIIQRCISMMEEDLGTDQCFINDGKVLYLYVDKFKRIIGAIVLDNVQESQTFRITSFEEVSTVKANSACTNKEISQSISSATENHNKVGIRLMWVHCNYRRQGIMRTMVDVVRQHFIFGVFVDKNDITFSQPTEQGFQFAKSYLGKGYVSCYSCNPN